MPDVVAGGGTLRLDGPLPPGVRAYVDSDWARDREGPVPALFVDGPEPDAAAARTLAAMAADVLELVVGVEPESIEVGGDGAVARLVRSLTGAPSRAAGVPVAVVDTSGTSVSVSDALRRVADLGLVVIAAAVRDPLTLSLYPDLHVRGLELRCVGPAGEGAPVAADATTVLSETLSVVHPGGSLDDSAAWYRIGPRRSS
jgi:hypothetical protein